jgi:hypothetical protein
VRTLSRTRQLALWATAAAAAVFIVANVMFLADGPPPAPSVAMAPAAPPPAAEPAPHRENLDALAKAVPAPGGDAKRAGERKDADRALDEALAREGAARPAAKAAPAPEMPKDGRKEQAAGIAGQDRKELAEAGKAKLEEKAPAKPGAPAPSAPPAAAPAPDPTAAALAPERDANELLGYLRNQLAQGNRGDGQSGPVNVTVRSAEIAKVRPQVEEIVRRYADRAKRDGALQQEHQADLKKSATVRREASTPLTLELTPTEIEALRNEIEKATGAQLVLGPPAEFGARARGLAAAPPAPAAKAEPERASAGRAPSGGAAAPRAAEEAAPATKQQQAPVEKPNQDPASGQNLANKDKNAQEAESRHVRQGETRIRIVINFLEIPVAEKK